MFLYYVTIPAINNATVLPSSTMSGRWPVLIFSHGLGGSRNAYSHLCGLLSSYGVVVVAPEHRDGSAPISFISNKDGSAQTKVDYKSISHEQTKEVEEARDEQLKIRLWELGLVHQALLEIDHGEKLSNLATLNTNGEHRQDLLQFTSSLDVHRPGSISWSGHSFGAATVIQFIKSVYHRPSPKPVGNYRPLYVPADDSAIVNQITPATAVSLLDLWTLPLRGASTRWLWERPLPCYSADGPGGRAILAILSEAFFKWRGNLVQTKRAVSAHPSENARRSSANPPYIFYPVKTAHLSQSDFGVLFPWTTKALFKAEEPERTLRLNVLAMLELMKKNGSQVAVVSEADKAAVLHPNHNAITNHRSPKAHANHHVNGLPRSTEISKAVGDTSDVDILSAYGSVKGWIPVSLEEEKLPGEGADEKTRADAPPTDAVMHAEIEN
jgi:platelet-activating factor acetylhydrolase